MLDAPPEVGIGINDDGRDIHRERFGILSKIDADSSGFDSTPFPDDSAL